MFQRKIEVTVHVTTESDSNPVDQEIATLHRDATALKDKNWPEAVRLLRLAGSLDAQHQRWIETARMIRLPLFLQQAGHFDEALAEFKQLIPRVPLQLQATLGHCSKLFLRAMAHHETALIYDKMRLACKRQKRLDLASDYEMRSQTHSDAWEALQPQLEMELEAEQAALEARVNARHASRRRVQ